MKVPKKNTTSLIIREKIHNKKILPSRGGFILLGGLLLALLVLLVAVLFLVWKKAHLNSNLLAIKPRAFTYKEIQHATRGFCEVLGRGTYGIVYRGFMELETRVEIAVKKLEIANEGEREFKSEVCSIGQTNHKNLVRMIGFCNEGKHRMLVYEYVSKGSLARFIFSDMKLGWNQRARIALGIAKGLHFLHEECSSQIIHCDIKPQNILLDDSLEPKISDFGVAKLLGEDQTLTSTFVRGTKGYLAPEWFKDPAITSKVDVYSFGIVLLEIICCKRNVERWALRCLETNSWEQLVEGDDEARADIGRVELFVRIALSCIQDDPALRPPMHEVAHTLAGDVTVYALPSPTSLD